MAKSKQDRLSEATDRLADAMAAVESIIDEVGEWRDNTEENFESCDWHQELSDCCDTLDEAKDSMESTLDDLRNITLPRPGA